MKKVTRTETLISTAGVHQQSVGITYRAKGLNDIASHFAKRAKTARDYARSEKKVHQKEILLAEAHTWEEAVSILRATTLETEEKG